MKNIRLQDLEFEPFISEEEIKQRVHALAQELKAALAEENPVFVCMLSGAFIFAADLLRAYDKDNTEISFLKWSSYQGTSSKGKMTEHLPLLIDVKGRTVVIIEDIVDSGRTLEALHQHLKEKDVKKSLVVSLLYKPQACITNYRPDWFGFEIPSKFVLGYGMDYNEQGRLLKSIYTLKEKTSSC